MKQPERKTSRTCGRSVKTSSAILAQVMGILPKTVPVRAKARVKEKRLGAQRGHGERQGGGKENPMLAQAGTKETGQAKAKVWASGGRKEAVSIAEEITIEMNARKIP